MTRSLREVTLVHIGRTTHFIEVDDPIGGGTPMCGVSPLRCEPGPADVDCWNCCDARRRLNYDGTYREPSTCRTNPRSQ